MQAKNIHNPSPEQLLTFLKVYDNKLQPLLKETLCSTLFLYININNKIEIMFRFNSVNVNYRRY